MKNITRIDDRGKYLHGYQVKVCVNQKIHTKFFSDSKWGGCEKAQEMAIQYLKLLREKLGLPNTERKISKNYNRLGCYIDGNNWVASIVDNEGKVMRKAFSMNKYGHLGARLLAKKQRRLWEKIYYQDNGFVE